MWKTTEGALRRLRQERDEAEAEVKRQRGVLEAFVADDFDLLNEALASGETIPLCWEQDDYADIHAVPPQVPAPVEGCECPACKFVRLLDEMKALVTPQPPKDTTP